MAAIVELVTLIIVTTLALGVGVVGGWLLHSRATVAYRRRWLEAVDTLQVQEDRYSELLTTGKPPSAKKSKSNAESWSLVTEVYDRGAATQRTCFLAVKVNHPKVPLGIYMWKADKRVGRLAEMSTVEVHREKYDAALALVEHMNEQESV